MKLKKILGISIVLFVLFSYFGGVVYAYGIVPALIILGITVVMVSLLCLGTYLID